MLETSSSRAGRSRLPPPPRMCSPTSWIVEIFERKFRRSSSSTSSIFGAIRSSSRSAYAVCPVRVRGAVTGSKDSRSGVPRSTAVVGELHGDAVVVFADQGDGALEVVLSPADDAHLVGLDGRLDLQLGVLDRFHDRLGLLDLDALHDLRALAHRAAEGTLDLPVLERLERDLPLDELRLQDVLDADELSLV